MDPNYPHNQQNRPNGQPQQPANWQQPNSYQQPSQWQQPSQYNQQQPPYQPPYYIPQQPPYQPPEQTGFSIAGLVMGILGLFTTCFCVGWIFGILGLVFSIVGKSKAPSQQGLNIAGLVLSIISIVLGLLILCIGLFSEYDDTYYYAASTVLNLL